MKNLILCFFILFIGIESFGQDLQIPSTSFSKKKTTYITLDDGTEISGTLKDLDYKKGIIKKIKIENADGKKVKLSPENINFMYLPQSNLDKFNKLTKFASDATLWKSKNIDQSKIGEGYIYFEKATLAKGKKESQLIFQLLNTSFSDNVKIYHDPFAQETLAVGVGGVALAGGDAKSYYVKVGDEPAFRLKKKDYKDLFSKLWADCPAVIEKYGDKIKWTEFPNHVFDYTNECNK